MDPGGGLKAKIFPVRKVLFARCMFAFRSQIDVDGRERGGNLFIYVYIFYEAFTPESNLKCRMYEPIPD